MERAYDLLARIGKEEISPQLSKMPAMLAIKTRVNNNYIVDYLKKRLSDCSKTLPLLTGTTF